MSAADDNSEARFAPGTDLVDEVRKAMRRFVRERDWERFHDPKNLAMALAGETGEVLEHFQWLTAQQSASLPPERRDEVALELADVLFYLVRLADCLDVDLREAARRKFAVNELRYPKDRVAGDARKYDRY